MTETERRRAHLYGIEAERLASLWLQARFYSVLDRRYTIKGGEIDLIVKRSATVAFVEIKARARIEDAEVSIDSFKIDRIGRAARHWGRPQPLGDGLPPARRRGVSRPGASSAACGECLRGGGGSLSGTLSASLKDDATRNKKPARLAPDGFAFQLHKKLTSSRGP